MKKILSLFLAFIMTVTVLNGVTVSAATVTASGTCGDNLTWTLDSDGVLTISGEGYMKNFTTISSIPWYKIRSNIKTVVIENGVISIGDTAFYNCTHLVSVKIPNSVTVIRPGSFQSCSSLLDIKIPNSVTTIGAVAFQSCKKLNDIIIGGGIACIERGAFNLCNAITNVYYADSKLAWNEIEIEEYNENLTDATIHFDFSMPEESENGVMDSGECGENLTWTLDSDGVLTINGEGEMWSYDLPWHSHKDSIVSVIIEEGVTTIGAAAFYECESLSEVKIANTVEYIGAESFYRCSSLDSIEIPNSVSMVFDYAFCYCDSLTSIELPDSVLYLFSGAFYNCSSLNTVSFGKNISGVGEGAFEECNELTDVYYRGTEAEWEELDIGLYNEPILEADIHFADEEASSNIVASGVCGENVNWTLDSDGVLTINGEGEMDDFADAYSTPWEDYMYLIKSVIISDGVTNIGDYSFYYCDTMNDLDIAKSVTDIGEWSFTGCSSLTEVEIPDNVTNIGFSAFSRCESLEKITLSDSVVTIGDYAFRNCYPLLEITIPETVTSIGVEAFGGCSALESIVVEEGNTVYHSSGNCLIETATNTLVFGCKNSVIPDYITTIGNSAFFYCEELTEITIPQSVISIGEYAFRGCSSLTEITIPDSVISIGVWAFWNCYSLTEVTISKSVQNIDEGAFDYCESLTDVYYTGIEEDWNSISIKEDNECLTNANIHFAEKEKEFKVFGNVTRFNNADVTVELLSDGEVVDSVTASGTYSFKDVAEGEYTVRVSAPKHATREYEITVGSEDVTQNVEIWFYGDVTKDGVINNSDVMQINRKNNNMTSVFNQTADADYRIKVANVTAITGTDTIINNADVIQINRKNTNMSSVFDRA